MKKLLSLALALLISFSLIGCGNVAPLSSNTNSSASTVTSTSNVDITWKEVGEGPQGWVIAIDIANNSDSTYVQSIDVTVNDESGNTIGESVVDANVAVGDTWSYPVHCEKANKYVVSWNCIDSDTVLNSESKLNANPKEFSLALEGTVDSLNESLESYGITLGNPAVSKGNTNELGKYTAYTYGIGPGASLVLYVSDSTENILNFTVLTISSVVTDESLNNTKRLIECLERGLAGDDADKVEQDLGLSNVTDDTFAVSSADIAEFMYIVQSGSLTFMATPA